MLNVMQIHLLANKVHMRDKQNTTLMELIRTVFSLQISRINSGFA